MLIYKLWWLQMLFFVLVLTPRCWAVDVSCISSCMWQLTQAARTFAIALKPLGGVVSAANSPQCQLTLPRFEPAVSTAGNMEANASLKETEVVIYGRPYDGKIILLLEMNVTNNRTALSQWSPAFSSAQIAVIHKILAFRACSHLFLFLAEENLMTWQICVFVACSKTIVHQLWTTLKKKHGKKTDGKK